MRNAQQYLLGPLSEADVPETREQDGRMDGWFCRSVCLATDVNVKFFFSGCCYYYSCSMG